LFSQCIVQPGFYYDGSSVVQCASGNYCTGGPINNAVQTPCPGGTTSPAGSSSQGQCAVPSGSWWTGTAVAQCPANNYCAGGPISGNPQPTPCPTGTTSPAGSSSQGQCAVPSGSWWTGTAVAQCPANNYCVGGPISGNPQPTPCPTGTTSLAGSSSQGQCAVPSGSWWTGTAVAQCPANNYCAGGPISGNPQPTPCPAGTVSDPGASSSSQCVPSSFSGVRTAVPTADVIQEGFTLCFSDTYDNTLNPTVIQSNCQQDVLLVACRPLGDATLTVAAMGYATDVFTVVPDTPTASITANGVQWYYGAAYSMGFAPAGATLSRNSCDTGATDGDQRLCWHTGGGGGWRCGTTTNLNSDAGWERVVYQRPGPL
jgi:hypothetical protein